MNRPATLHGDNSTYNFRDSSMNEVNSMSSATNENATAIVDVDEEPKHPDGHVNEDDVILTTRTTIVELHNDESDFRRRVTKGNKPISYAAKKTAAQGMMDIALLTSNANQLKNLITYQQNSITFHFVMSLIILSLMLQISVGVSLIFKGRFDSKGKDKAAAARVNTQIMAAVFLITVINIFIAVFSIPEPAQK